MADAGHSAPGGAPAAARAIGTALRELYNPAQIDVVVRIERLLATVHAPGGAGRADNEGFDAFVPLIDSGISLYVWSERRFLAVVVFTCKAFDVDRAVEVTRDFFALSDHEHSAF